MLLRERGEPAATDVPVQLTPPARVAEAPVAEPPRPGRRESRAVFLTSFSAYLGLGLWLVLVQHLVMVDALARVANASYVVTGRQPHLAAIGFVWNPLPSLAMVPLVALRPVAHVLVDPGLAATLTTALAMAGAVHQLHGLLLDARVGRGFRLLLTLAFAVHPMIAFYGANGMSEAWLLLGLAYATRRLARWLREPRTADLVGCAVGLAIAGLARYEAVAAAAAVPVLVLAQSWVRARADTGLRRWTALNDAVLVALPAAVCFIAWAVLSWVVVGHPFETFRSPYGNSAQVDEARGYLAQVTASGAAGRAGYVGEQVVWLAPALLLLLPVGLAAALSRRGRHVLAPVATFGSVLLFQAAAFVHGDTFGWLRFSLCAVPLALALAGLLAATPRERATRIAAGELAVGLAFCCALTSWYPFLDHRLGREEAGTLLPIIAPARATDTDRATLHRFENERDVARWLDGLHLPEGAVLVDTAPGFAIVLASRHPSQFLITSDLDFEAAVADPAVYGVRYLLVQPSPLDAINIAYPGIYDEGRAFVRLVQEFPARGVGVPWRVYEITERI